MHDARQAVLKAAEGVAEDTLGEDPSEEEIDREEARELLSRPAQLDYEALTVDDKRPTEHDGAGEAGAPGWRPSNNL